MALELTRAEERWKRLRNYTILGQLVWVLIVGLSLAWNIADERYQTRELIANEARANFNKDQAIRLWAAKHGGVYVPATEETPPNPYLSHIPDRDIRTPSGKQLTLMNPAYMLRQLMDEFSVLYGIKGRITSLKLHNPNNQPDEWEIKALEAFERGAEEVFEVADLNGEPHLRLMQPMLVKEECLKCHAYQGYKVGEVRGGVGVSVPMSPFLVLEREHLLTEYLSHGGVWPFGALGILFFALINWRRTSEALVAEEALEKARHYLQNVIDSMPSILVGVDVDGNVTHWNKEAEQATGLSPAQASGRKLEDVLPQVSSQITLVKESPKDQQQKTLSKVPYRLDGTIRYWDIMLYPLSANEMIGTVIRIDDVTDRTRIETMMVQTEKMLSLGGLAAGMAHEINNPLSGILQSAENARRRLSAELPANLKAAEELGINFEKLQKYLEKRRIPVFFDLISESGKRASDIIVNMLGFARRADDSMEPVDMAALIDEVLGLAAMDYDLKKKYDFKNIEHHCEFESDMPLVPCIRSEVEQVLLNLLTNAAHAFQESESKVDDPKFVFRLKRDGDMALIEVTDNGPGMSEDIRRRVFEPFFTTRPPGKGTGLGLSVAYFIVSDEHRGLMEVESSPGEGATFKIWLPLKQEQN